MGLADRLREVMGSMSPADLARSANVTASAVTQWLDGTTKGLRAETAARLEAATGYSASWISTGKGPKRRDQARGEPRPLSSSMQPILAWEHPDDLPAGEYVMIPRLGMSLAAGSGREQVQIEFVERQPQAFRADWIRAERLKPARLACLTASGTSMEPTIWDGDSLVVDTSQVEVVDGKVYALWYEGGERVKRLYRLPGGALRIKSDNVQFDSMDLAPEHAEQVRIIGRVVHRSGKGGL